MTDAPAVAPQPASRFSRVRSVGTAVLVALTALIAFGSYWNARLPAAGFDTFQLLSPREVQKFPVTIVEIDERSLASVGRWPWPRDTLARLVDRIGRHQPAAVGLDIFMPEADPLSPDEFLRRAQGALPAPYDALAALPSNDALLARALAATRAVLPIVGTVESTGTPVRVAPFSLAHRDPGARAKAPALPGVTRFGGARTSLPELDRAATGWGLISLDATGGIVRNVPLAATIDGTLVPAFAVEMVRVAVGAPSLRLVVSGTSVDSISIGGTRIPTEADGSARIYFSPRIAARRVSAVDVLNGTVDPQRIAGRMVLVGVTGDGLADFHSTPLGIAMPGSEIHAQLMECIVLDQLLIRPWWGSAVESIVFLVLGALLVWVTPIWKPRYAAWLHLSFVAAIGLIAYLAFRTSHLLLDAVTPGLGLLLLFGVLVVLTLADSNRQRRVLEQAVLATRELSLRMAGELEAARQIQIASLPDPVSFRDDTRLDLAAEMRPAREVGGDLYDFFRLDDRRFFLLVGDVAGKGLSASIFMAVSKALYKSTTLRVIGADLGTLMTQANAEVSRDNAQMMFVTAFAGVLDLETGELEYCNAGHENPYIVDASVSSVRRLEDGGGPPLCTVDDYAYRSALHQLRPGELLCVISDGVTEARGRNDELFGSERVCRTLLDLGTAGIGARTVVAALHGAARSYTAGADPDDDLTVLALRWNGPGRKAAGIAQFPARP